MMNELEATVRELADRQAITDCLLRYCRGVDRLDRELMLSAYHEDAIDDHGIVVLGAADFVDWALDYHRTHNLEHHHGISNTVIDLDGDVAHAETYYTFFAINPQPPNSLAVGRYIDRLERRKGRWAIAQRICLTEGTHEIQPASIPAAYAEQLFGNGPRARDRSDVSYQRPLMLERAERAKLREGAPATRKT